MLEKIIAYFTAMETRHAEKRIEKLRTEAESKAKSKFNIERHEGIDYITFMGNAVSTKEDFCNKDSMPLCDRLDIYRKRYIAKCIEKGECE